MKWSEVLVTQSCATLCDPWTVAHQAPLSMEFSRREYWSGLPFPPPGALPDPGIEPTCPAMAGRFFTTETTGKSYHDRGACITQWSYEPWCAGPPKMDGSQKRVQKKHGPLEERMANHSSILAARTPWTVWKGKKIWHQKISLISTKCLIFAINSYSKLL